MSTLTRRSFILGSAALLLAGCHREPAGQSGDAEEQSQDTVPEQSEEVTPASDTDGTATVSEQTASGATTMTLTINDRTYTATLQEGEAAAALVDLLPLTVEMTELNNNEKYVYLEEDLPCAEEQVGFVEAGDLMLFGPDCLVLFYDSFDTSYMYTRLGKLDDPSDIADAVGTGPVTVTFSQE